ncbi:MAG: hypothetical protein GXP35_06575 [Actinobacteria bacterium]|nr:hypothetical protein [Actinomycetota bacterium]
MSDQPATNGGISVDGVQVDRDDHYMDLLRYVSVPEHLQRGKEFTTGTAKEVGALEDPQRRQIIDALLASNDQRIYSTREDLETEVSFRSVLLQTMNGFQTGAKDSDYLVPDQLHPQVGGTKVAKDAWDVAQWAPVDATDLWSPAWKAEANSTADGLLSPSAIFPYRGECAGAFQICVFAAGYAALSEAMPSIAQLQIGDWNSPVRAYMTEVPLGSDPIPGDYLYFKNKDDYLSWAPNGAWQGLNSMYMGRDLLGTMRYSGLGAPFLSEHTVREYLVNAYFHDCFPHKVDHPDTEARFTKQATVALPSSSPTAPVHTPPEVLKASTPTAEDLLAAGFVAHPENTLAHQRGPASLADVAHALGFGPADLRQTASAPAFGASYQVPLGAARCVVAPADGSSDATDRDTIVVSHVHIDPTATRSH